MNKSPKPKKSRARPALYRRILANIEKKVLSGEWGPGHRIPIEFELTAKYRCSRMTVNKVVSQLARNGLLERRRKAGTFVRQPHREAAILDIHQIKAEVVALSLPYRFEILRRRKHPITRAERERWGVTAVRSVLDLSCRHFAGPRVFCLEQRLISLRAVPQASNETFDAEAPGTWLLAHVPWTEAEHRIAAVGANRAIASTAGIPVGTPCLEIQRRTWRGAVPVTFVRLTYAGANHQLVARFKPNRE